MDALMKLQSAMHEHYGFKAVNPPGLLPEEQLKMRLNFLLEEIEETAKACGYLPGITDDYGIAFERCCELTQVKPEEVLDGLVDLLVVLLGTAHLMGFFKQAELVTEFNEVGEPIIINNTDPNFSIFEEAYKRVWIANMQKQVGKTKRGHQIDLVKPEDWKKPDLSDLVKDFNKIVEDNSDFDKEMI